MKKYEHTTKLEESLGTNGKRPPSPTNILLLTEGTMMLGMTITLMGFTGTDLNDLTIQYS
jgi:hypothetical protein